MATRPSTLPGTWATDPGTRATLTTVRRDVGWLPAEPLPALSINTLWGESLDWTYYLADGDVAFKSIAGIGGTGDDLTITADDLTIDAQDRIVITAGIAASDDVSIILDGDLLAFTSATSGLSAVGTYNPVVGWIFQHGHLVYNGTVDDGVRFGYYSSADGSATQLEIDYYLADNPGGWTPAAVGARMDWNAATGQLECYHNGTTAFFYRDLTDVIRGFNAEIDTAGSHVIELTEIAGNLASTSPDDVRVQIIRQLRASPYTESATLRLPSSGAPHIGAAASYTDTGTEVIDLSTYRYYLRVDTNGASGSAAAVAVRDLVVTALKRAVE